eukprot:gene11220-7792_t
MSGYTPANAFIHPVPDREDSSSAMSLVGRRAMRLDTNPISASWNDDDEEEEDTGVFSPLPLQPPFPTRCHSHSNSNPFAARDPNTAVASSGLKGGDAVRLLSCSSSPVPRTAMRICSADIPCFSTGVSCASLPSATGGGQRDDADDGDDDEANDDAESGGRRRRFQRTGLTAPVLLDEATVMRMPARQPSHTRSPAPHPQPLKEETEASAWAAGSMPAQSPDPRLVENLSSNHAEGPQQITRQEGDATASTDALFVRSRSLVRSGFSVRSDISGMTALSVAADPPGHANEEAMEPPSPSLAHHLHSTEAAVPDSPIGPRELVGSGSTQLVSGASLVAMHPTTWSTHFRLTQPERQLQMQHCEDNDIDTAAATAREEAEEAPPQRALPVTSMASSRRDAAGTAMTREAEVGPTDGPSTWAAAPERSTTDASSRDVTSAASSSWRSAAVARPTPLRSWSDVEEEEQTVVPLPAGGRRGRSLLTVSFSPECRPPYAPLPSREVATSAAPARCSSDLSEHHQSKPHMEQAETAVVASAEEPSPPFARSGCPPKGSTGLDGPVQGDGQQRDERSCSLRTTLSLSALPLQTEAITTIAPVETTRTPSAAAGATDKGTELSLASPRSGVPPSEEEEEVVERWRPRATSPSVGRLSVEVEDLISRAHEKVRRTRESLLATLQSAKEQLYIGEEEEDDNSRNHNAVGAMHKTASGTPGASAADGPDESILHQREEEEEEERPGRRGGLLVGGHDGIALRFSSGASSSRLDGEGATPTPAAMGPAATLRHTLPPLGPVLGTRLAGYDTANTGYLPMATLLRVMETLLRHRGSAAAPTPAGVRLAPTPQGHPPALDASALSALGSTTPGGGVMGGGAAEQHGTTGSLAVSPGGWATPRYQRLDLSATKKKAAQEEEGGEPTPAAAPADDALARGNPAEDIRTPALLLRGSRKRQRTVDSPTPPPRFAVGHATRFPALLPHPDAALDEELPFLGEPGAAAAEDLHGVTRRSPTRTLERIPQQQRAQQEELRLTELLVAVVDLFHEEFGRRYTWKHFGVTNVSRHDPKVMEALQVWKSQTATATDPPQPLSLFFPRLQQVYAPMHSSSSTAAAQCPPLDALVDYRRFVRSLDKLRETSTATGDGVQAGDDGPMALDSPSSLTLISSSCGMARLCMLNKTSKQHPKGLHSPHHDIENN